MNTLPDTHQVPALPITAGQWCAIYWEPVMLTGERICVGFLTCWDGRAKAELTVRPDLLITLFGGAGAKAQTLLERAFKLMQAQTDAVGGIHDIRLPISGLYLGGLETSHVNSYAELLQVAKLMSSSLSTLAEPDAELPELTDARGEQAVPARQFATRVRDLVLLRNSNLAVYFHKEAYLLGKRRATRFGFLSDSLAAHFGLLQPTNVRNSARMARGLIAELSIAQRASGRTALLVLGFPSLDSPTLTDKERSAIEDYTEELGLEASEFSVRYAATDTDAAACDALMSAL
ncbi:hypothetical protein Acav_4674 [Paracidovorax avenae ATCC 19860]|uniref:Uncharacterized protein n=1 Tax=Paracidovorax avenae (strain ATCC 19860 / DSM 7227 / CCUG 15838 / JCM 20985 / LMG 2117 / NCPPB 1011) TaxID=643561 RepID=F0QBT7_PARA1|nr:hypothetical protein [Paracidovorax avenae]ADX48553.1 hypothetical protein Acav_4674 [Paracidovorax avenae ATCC 19860]